MTQTAESIAGNAMLPLQGFRRKPEITTAKKVSPETRRDLFSLFCLKLPLLSESRVLALGAELKSYAIQDLTAPSW